MAIILRSQKGSPLTNTEVDGNFTDLDGRVTTAQSTANAAQPKEAGKGLSTNDLTNALKTKLDGIAAGATANATNAQLRDRGTHTGTQLASTISNFATAALGIALTGLSVASGTAVVATDSLLIAIGKLQKQINDAITAIANKADKGANNDITSLSGLSTPLSVAQGGTGGSSQPAARTSLGLGAAATVNISFNDGDVAPTYSLGRTRTSLASQGWYTNIDQGVDPNLYQSGATDVPTGGTGYWYKQTFRHATTDNTTTIAWPYGLSGLSGTVKFQNTYNGVKNGWVEFHHTANSLLDPALGTGGLMSYTVVSGYSIFKFASGVMIMQGQAGESGVMPANSVNVKSITIPSGFISVNFIQPMAMVTPYNIYDLIGAPECIMPSITSLRLTIRTGPTSQNAAMAITIIGRWK